MPLVREAHPQVEHERARASVARVWAVLRDEAGRVGVPVSEVDDVAVRRRLGLLGAVDEAVDAHHDPDGHGPARAADEPGRAGGPPQLTGPSGAGGPPRAGGAPEAGGPGGDDDAVLLTALRVVRAAARAYGG